MNQTGSVSSPGIQHLLTVDFNRKLWWWKTQKRTWAFDQDPCITSWLLRQTRSHFKNTQGHIWMAITVSNLLGDICKDFQVQKTKIHRAFLQQSHCYQVWLQLLIEKTQLLTPKTRKGGLILLAYFWKVKCSRNYHRTLF